MAGANPRPPTHCNHRHQDATSRTLCGRNEADTCFGRGQSSNYWHIPMDLPCSLYMCYGKSSAKANTEYLSSRGSILSLIGIGELTANDAAEADRSPSDSIIELSHRCHNPNCVVPGHISLGLHTVNMSRSSCHAKFAKSFEECDHHLAHADDIFKTPLPRFHSSYQTKEQSRPQGERTWACQLVRFILRLDGRTQCHLGNDTPPPPPNAPTGVWLLIHLANCHVPLPDIDNFDQSFVDSMLWCPKSD